MPTEINALERLHKFVAGFPNQRKAADALGITQGYLSDLVNCRRDISPAILEKLGLRRTTVSK